MREARSGVFDPRVPLPGWCEDNGKDPKGINGELLQNGEGKGGCLATAGFCARDTVAPCAKKGSVGVSRRTQVFSARSPVESERTRRGYLQEWVGCRLSGRALAFSAQPMHTVGPFPR